MRCGSCGRESPDSYKFCEFCGSILAKAIDLRDSRLEGPRQMVVRAIHERAKTDRIVSPLWIVVIILVEILALVLDVVLTFWYWNTSLPFDSPSSLSYTWIQTVTGLISFLATIIIAWFFYTLVKRQNDHYNREASLRIGVSSLIRAAAWSPERTNDVAPEMMAISMVERRQEQHRSVWFWTFVILLPSIASVATSVGTQIYFGSDSSGEYYDMSTVALLIPSVAAALIALVLTLYMFYFLTQTMMEHDSRWNSFAYNSRRALSKLGFPTGRPYRVSRLPERSMVLYILLTIFTGIFALYWMYVLAKDPNEHFKYQWEFEDNFMSAISPVESWATYSASRR